MEEALALDFRGCRLRVMIGDITRLNADAIVNAANSSLMGGGGVDGAIHRAGGPRILEECRRIRRTRYPDGLPTGQAVSTTAGELPALKVIHTVGPVYHDLAPDEAADLLAECYRNALQVARDENLQSIAFPGISTGVYGYPQDEAADVAIAAVLGELSRHGAPREVIFSAFDSGAADAYAQRLPAAVRSMPDQEMRG